MLPRLLREVLRRMSWSVVCFEVRASSIVLGAACRGWVWSGLDGAEYDDPGDGRDYWRTARQFSELCLNLLVTRRFLTEPLFEESINASSRPGGTLA